MGERLNSQHFERKRKPFCEVDHIIFVFAHLLKFFCEMHHIFELFLFLISIFLYHARYPHYGGGLIIKMILERNYVWTI